MTKKFFRILFFIIFISILGYHFKLNYDLEVKPPSKNWSKEYLVSNGVVKTYPKIIKVNDKYIIAHDNGSKINLLEIDKMGKKLNEGSIDAGDIIVRDLNLLYDGKIITANWIITENSEKILNTTVFNSELKETSRHKTKGVEEVAQIGDDMLVSLIGDKIVISSLKDNKNYTIENENPSGLIAGTKLTDGYLVTFMNKSQEFKYFTIKNGNISTIKIAGIMHKNNFDAFDKTVIAADNNNGYILVENKVRGTFGNVKCLAFKLDGSDYKINNLKLGDIRYLYNPVSVSSGDEARFIACCERQFGKKDDQYDVVDFSIKDSQIIKNDFLSRTRESAMFPGINEELAVFCDHVDGDNYNICLSSQDTNFKKMVNGVKGFEVKNAVRNTFEGLINSFSYMFVLGARWILLGVVLIGIFTFLSYSLNEKKKKIAFLIVYILTQFIKFDIMNSLFYVKYEGIMPGLLGKGWFGMGIMGFLGLITLIYGYMEYKRNLDAMPLISYIKALIIDSILTLMIFIPFYA